MPPLLDPHNVYAADGPGNLSPKVAQLTPRVYVPNSGSNTVDVIDPASFKIVGHFAVGRQPQHITPSYDLEHLWVLNDLGDSLTEIDPATGKNGKTIKVKDPYNMYYTPDGQFADRRRRAGSEAQLPEAVGHEARRVGQGALPRRRSHGLRRQRPVPHREL